MQKSIKAVERVTKQVIKQSSKLCLQKITYRTIVQSLLILSSFYENNA